jgi:hypothetical protein
VRKHTRRRRWRWWRTVCARPGCQNDRRSGRAEIGSNPRGRYSPRFLTDGRRLVGRVRPEPSTRSEPR